MPNVYKDSYIVPEEMNKFPAHGEREMLEQEDSIQTAGSVSIPESTFLRWMELFAAKETGLKIQVPRFVDMHLGAAPVSLYSPNCGSEQGHSYLARIDLGLHFGLSSLGVTSLEWVSLG